MSRTGWILSGLASVLAIVGLTIGWLHAQKEEQAQAMKTSLVAPPPPDVDESIFPPCLCEPCASNLAPVELVKTNSPATDVNLSAPVSGGGAMDLAPNHSQLAAVTPPRRQSGVRHADGSLWLEAPLTTIQAQTMRLDLSILYSANLDLKTQYGRNMFLSADAMMLKDTNSTGLQFIAGAMQRFDPKYKGGTAEIHYEFIPGTNIFVNPSN